MTDNVNHPQHYAEGWSNGAEVIDITENLNFNRGNAVKYIARAGKKNPDAEVEDLRKAHWYLTRELKRIEAPVEPQPVERVQWSLEGVNEELMKLWDGRTVSWRQWQRLDHVPPGVIVEDRDGDYYRRIGGTAKFAWAYREEVHGQHYEWQDMTNGMYRDVDDYGPFKEVISG